MFHKQLRLAHAAWHCRFPVIQIDRPLLEYISWLIQALFLVLNSYLSCNPSWKLNCIVPTLPSQYLQMQLCTILCLYFSKDSDSHMSTSVYHQLCHIFLYQGQCLLLSDNNQSQHFVSEIHLNIQKKKRKIK